MQVGHGARLGRRRTQSLEVAHDVVGRIPHEAAGQRKIGAGARRLRPRRAGQCGAQRLQQFRLISRDVPPVGAAPEALRIELDPKRGVTKTDERVTTHPLATLHALKQEARPERAQFQERRNGRVQITSDVERCLHKTKTHPGERPEMGLGC